LYEELTKLDSAEVQLRAQGFAGLAIVDAQLGEDEQAVEALFNLNSNVSLLDDVTSDEIARLKQRLGVP
jgi:hypothetical protein